MSEQKQYPYGCEYKTNDVYCIHCGGHEHLCKPFIDWHNKTNKKTLDDLPKIHKSKTFPRKRRSKNRNN